MAAAEDIGPTSVSTLYEHFRVSTGICTDTRRLAAGQLFVALKGPSFDGNRFAQAALEGGASSAVVDDPALGGHPDCLLVNDGLAALQALAREHRKRLRIPVLAITGSNGKTTTKELLATVLGRRFRTFATRGNLNNHIGVPLSILEIGKGIEFAVIEMGANHRGEIADLCRIADPDHGLITNIGKAHLEGFGGLRGIQQGKGELYAHLRNKGGLIFWDAGQILLAEMVGDYPNAVAYSMATALPQESLIPALTGHAIDPSDASEAETDPERYAALRCVANPSIFPSSSEATEFELHSHLVGAFNRSNLLAAACVGLHFGVRPSEISEAISSYRPSNNRSQWLEAGGNRYILDHYNANPSSMDAALAHFAGLSGRKGLFLGDMLELGADAEPEHRRIIEAAIRTGADPVVFVGPLFEAAGAAEAGLHFADSESARQWFAARGYQGYTFLFKGSRGIALERVLGVLAA